MKVFHCDGCQSLVFFENTTCVSCGRRLGYVPEVDDMVALEPVGDGLWRSARELDRAVRYRQCANYSGAGVCNWVLPSTAVGLYCLSCRLTRVIPDLSRPEHQHRWFKIERAKRRLVRQLHQFGLPLASRAEDPRGVVFDLLAEPDDASAPRIFTGHAAGVITLSIAEADDAERERRRQELGEPYRTLLGHVRHEIGHYYWDRLVAGSRWFWAFRGLFGDERWSYAEALARHYQNGPPADWQSRYVSAYASAHPWEDWTETWTHYLHITDSVETARASGLSLMPRRSDEPALLARWPTAPLCGAIEQVIQDWFPLTYVLNELNRGMGMPDPYPFVLTPAVIEKLSFVDRVVAGSIAGK